MIYPAIKKAAMAGCLLLFSYFCLLAQIGKLDTRFYNKEGIGYYATCVAVLPDSSIVVGGDFVSVSGRSINRIAKLKKDGTNDYSFDPGSGFSGTVLCLALQADGKLLVAGDFTSFNGTACSRIARLNADGSLDNTFNIGTGFNAVVRGLALQPDGKILAVGDFVVYKGNSISRVVRIKSNGDRDSSFVTGTNTFNYAVALQPDGKVIVGGPYSATLGAMRRLNTNGSLDTTFNAGGTGPNGQVSSIQVLGDGKIVIGGVFTSYNGSTANRIALLNANGNASGSFSSGAGLNNVVFSILVEPSSKIIVGGDFTSYAGTSISRIVRIDTTGTRDTTFNPGSGLNEDVLGLAMYPGGGIMLAGRFNTCDAYARPSLARIDGNGSVDQSFFNNTGLNGFVWDINTQSSGNAILGGDFTRYSAITANRIARVDKAGNIDTTFHTGTGFNNRVAAIKVLPDDKILVAGRFTQYNGTAVACIVRLNADGSLDNTFTAGTNNNIEGMGTDAQGRIYICGSFTSVNGTTKSRLARIGPDGATDNGFVVGTFSSNATVYTLALQPDGKVVAGGSFSTYMGTMANNLCRIDTNGLIDTAFSSHGGANNVVRAVALEASGHIVLAGNFNTYNGYGLPSLARLKGTGVVDSTFKLNSINSRGLGLAAYNGGVVLVGDFSSVNGVAGTACMAYIDSAGAVDTAFFHGTGINAFNSTAECVHVDARSGRVLVGGSFHMAQDRVSANLAGFIGKHEGIAIDSIRIDTLVCAGGSTTVVFKKIKNFNLGNVFTVQLSDGTGSFAIPTAIGSKAAEGTGWDNLSVNIPDNALGSGYRLKITSTNAMYISGTSNTFKIDTSRPVTPVVPTALSICSDTTYTFIFDSLQTNTDSIEWSYSSDFAVSDVVDTAHFIVKVEPGKRDTVWARGKGLGGCTSSTVSTILAVNWKPGPLTPPAPQTANSLSPYTFNFGNIRLGYKGNRLEWALDSLFAGSNYLNCHDTIINGKDTSYCSISITVSPYSDTLVWMRSIDTATGCKSGIETTIGIVTHVFAWDSIVLDSVVSVCSGSAANIRITATNTYTRYYLKHDTATIASSTGNGSTLVLNTGAIVADKVVYVFTRDTITGDTATLGHGTLIQPLDSIGTVRLYGDTFVYTGDTLYYEAVANNGLRAIYSISGGGAAIDSLTGMVSNIMGDFTVQATMQGPAGCGTGIGYLDVEVTTVAPPTVPVVSTVYLDSLTQLTTIVIDSIMVGAGGNQIEWSTSRNFDSVHVLSSPGTISIALSGVQDTVIWLRSKNTIKGEYSTAIYKDLHTKLPHMSAGLLDKTYWQLDDAVSDEFDYEFKNQFSFIDLWTPNDKFNFFKKWTLIYNWGGGVPNANDICNYSLWHLNADRTAASTIQHQIELLDWGNCPANPNRTESGAGHEVIFVDGKAVISVSRLPVDTVVTSCFNSPVLVTKEKYYKAGQLGTVRNLPMVNAMVEVRAKLVHPAGQPDGRGGVWNYNGKGDFTLIDGASDTKINSAVGDDPLGSCSIEVDKESPCSYSEDWHTYTLVCTNNQVIRFIDGKETWSTKFATATSLGQRWPSGIYTGSPESVPWWIGVSAMDWDTLEPNPEPEWWDSASMEVDYFRFYTPMPNLGDTNPPMLQNYSVAGEAKTFEYLYNNKLAYYNTPAPNNNPLYITNRPQHKTHDISFDTKVISARSGPGQLFYIGSDQRCYNAYVVDNEWREDVLLGTVADLAGDLTVYKDRIYYRSTHNTIKFFQWLSGINQWVNIETNVATDGFFNIDALGRLFHINEGNVFAWGPTGNFSGQNNQISFDNKAERGLNVHSCGCLMFYEDGIGTKRQQSWWNNWRENGVIVAGTSSGISIMDESNKRLFFAGVDHDIHCYPWDYNQADPARAEKLAKACTAYDNAWYVGHLDAPDPELDRFLALSNGILYYTATDGNIWYYFNDKENRQSRTPNWYRTAIRNTFGWNAILVEPKTGGRMFYVNGEHTLNMIDWQNADNQVECPRVAENDLSPIIGVFKNKGTETGLDSVQQRIAKGASILAYPNPSHNVFNFEVSASQDDGCDIYLYNLSGMLVGELHGKVMAGETQRFTWETRDLDKGVYFYKANFKFSDALSGKLVKL